MGKTKNTLGRILLVEDISILQKLHGHYLDSLNYSFDLANTGTKAIAMFNHHYDLVLMDICLPDMTGIEVSRQIRRNYPKDNTPIIALTSHEDEMKQACLEAGMQDFSTKPIRLAEFKNLLSQWIT